MNDAEYNQVLEKSLRGKLSAGEAMALEAYLATRPELRAAWEDDLALNQLLHQVKVPPVSSNFTALVLQEVAGQDRRARTRAGWWGRWWGLGWTRPAAAAGLLVAAGLFSLHQHHANERARLAVALRQFSQAPNVETLKDFDAINRLGLASQYAVPE
jgi:anti-sigma factor RsiW